MLREKFMTIFPRSPIWSVIQESAKRPNSSDHISTNIARKALKFGSKIQRDLFSNQFFLSYETSQKTKLSRKWHDDLFGAVKP